jgi:hypothetical protein
VVAEPGIGSPAPRPWPLRGRRLDARREGSSEAAALGRLLGRLETADPLERSAAQRALARLVAEHPDLLDHRRLRSRRPEIELWGRFVPFLRSDEVEETLARLALVRRRRWLDTLAALDATPGLAQHEVQAALDLVEDTAPVARAEAMEVVDAISLRRAPLFAAILDGVVSAQAADDAIRGVPHWRHRFALVEGTSTHRLGRLLGVCEDAVAPGQWHAAITQAGPASTLVASPGSLPASARSLTDAVAYVTAVLTDLVPSYASAVQAAARTVRAGTIDECTLDERGIVTTVRFRPGIRGLLAVAHELGHATHLAVLGTHAAPGALVGETVACVAAQAVGRSLLRDSTPDEQPAVATGLGDHVVADLYRSAVVSRFEDDLRTAVGDEPLHPEVLADRFADRHRTFFGGSAPSPGHRWWWSHLSLLVEHPGEAVAYVWANLVAAAVLDGPPADVHQRFGRLLGAGGVGADESLRVLELEPGWSFRGEAACAGLLDECAAALAIRTP